MFGRLRDEAQLLVDEVITLAYFMKGGITYGELMNMTSGVRDRVQSFVKARLEAEAKSFKA